jgi:ATP-dependent Clp protease ATP-binding subunit ClpA
VSDLKIHFQTVTLRLGDELEHTVCHGFPTVSALGEKAGRGAVGLRAKVKQLLESPAEIGRLTLHRRLTGTAPQVHELRMRLVPAAKRADWREPVELCLDYVTWQEADDQHLAFVPALGVQVIASKAEHLPRRVEAHARLVLLERVKQVKLRDLAACQGARILRAEELGVTAKFKTPRQVEEEATKEGEKKSVLGEVAVRWARTTVTPAFEVAETLAQVRELLGARQPASVLLVGPPGVGKTAVVRELARSGTMEIWSTSGARLIAGQSGFGQWQERCRELCREVAKSKVVLHLGGLAELMEVGRHSANSQSIAGFLRPLIDRGELLAIVECTPEQLAVIERTEPQLAAAFAQVRVAEPDESRTRRILEQVFRQHTKRAEVPPAAAAALEWLLRLHRRYATYSAHPGRPLRFLTPMLTAEPAGPAAAALEPAQVTAAFTRETGLPAVLLDDALPLDLAATRAWFDQRVIGQGAAVAAVVDLLATIKARLNRPRQPLASMLFVGPTGTGKTELAKALAEFLFGSAGRLTRFDLSEFGDPQAVRRLIGGANDGEGLLTARVREQPFGVLLLDEFEKADPSFFDLLLQVLGDGRLTDAAGRVADFCNTVVIMTSNLGAREFQRGSVGFLDDRDGMAHFEEATRKFLRPEIYNRLGAVLGFQALGGDLMRQITRRHLDLVRQRDGLRDREVELRLGEGVEDYLAARGHEPKYGARPLKRVLEAELMVPLAEALNQARPGLPLVAEVARVANGLRIHLRQRTDPAEATAALRVAGTAAGVLALRRQVAKLARSAAVVALENEVPVLAMLERRQGKHRWADAADHAGLGRLREIRRTLGELQDLTARAEALETQVLGSFHLGQHAEDDAAATDLTEIEGLGRSLRQTIFRLGFAQPDEVVVAVFGGNREWLLELLKAYLAHHAELGGDVAGFEFILPPVGRAGAEAQPRREAVKDLAKPLATLPAGWIGAVMHLRGESCYPRFEPEAGLHKSKDKGASHLCLVETSAPGNGGVAAYTPPSGIHRAGGIHEKSAKIRRTFNVEAQTIIDDLMGEAPWPRGELAGALHRLLEARLTKATEAIA